jgi:hypothetical protein
MFSSPSRTTLEDKIAMQERRQAKTILERLVAREPALIEALRALASRHERDGDWQAATTEYRAILNLKR